MLLFRPKSFKYTLYIGMYKKAYRDYNIEDIR